MKFIDRPTGTYLRRVGVNKPILCLTDKLYDLAGVFICKLKIASRSKKTHLRTERRHRPLLPLLLAFFCLSGAGLLAWRGDLPCWLAIYYAGLSLLTFLVYGWDKRAARLQQRRVAESTLHTMSLAGGWPGALIAQNRLRHKSRKVAFLVRFWCTVIVNLVVVYWLYFQI